MICSVNNETYYFCVIFNDRDGHDVLQNHEREEMKRSLQRLLQGIAAVWFLGP